MPLIATATSKTNGMVLITGTSVPKLAGDISKILKEKVYFPVSVFANGEIMVKIPVPVRNKHVIIIQSTSPPVNDHIMELLLMIDAARRASAGEITSLIPHYGYSRQDRKDSPRVPISSALIADLIEHAGADRIITLDIHSEQQQGFIKHPWDNLYASHALIPVLKKLKLKHVVIASPDKGGMTRASAYATRLNAEGVAIVYKERDTNVKNISTALDMIGDVKGRDVILVDDIIDTAGTMVNAAILMKKRGANRIILAATHGLFSPPALKYIDSEVIEQVIVTDTITPRKDVSDHLKIKICSVAPLLAEVIKRTHNGGSLNQELID
jgi:ribose-phosphate pyrophosphokinase